MDITYFKEFVENLGYTFISKVGRKITVKCSEGHIFDRDYSNFKKCPRCIMCDHQKDTEFLKTIGYTVLSREGNFVQVECPKGHTFNRKVCEFKRNNNCCPECEEQKYSILVNNLGFKFIKREGAYITASCPNGHTIVRDWRSFNKGHSSCPHCDEQAIHNFLHSLGYILLEKGEKKLKVKCPCGHTFERSLSVFKSGSTTCPDCNEQSVSNFIEKLGYKFLGRVGDKIQVQCSKGHTFERRLSHFNKGYVGCCICTPALSSFELNVENELNSLNLNYKTNVFNVIPNRELDFYLPEYNLAIECNGDYWHSTEFKDSTYHLEKYNLCKEKGIRLIQIPESEWYSNKEWFISLIRCYIENGDFTQFLEGSKFNLMYLSESLFNNYTLVKPELICLKNCNYYNCGYGILNRLKGVDNVSGS